ncbi:MAG TPA: hypothetical protein VFI59_02625 [Actinomycetota bacterium]|nr:hypothetical protein [Actinomycetota bacterium]
MRRARLAAIVAVLATVAAACSGDGISIEIGSPQASGSAVGGPSEAAGRTGLTVDPVHTGEERALGAMRALCVGPTPTGTDDDGAPADTPADVEELEAQVEQVREREFLRDVVVQPVSADEIAAKLEGAFDETYPKEFYDRRSVAWQTIGVLPDTGSIRDALLAYQTGQVVGFYNPLDGELVYRADGDLDLLERVTLAHELTHAIDDQHFDLARIDEVAAACRDEAFQAALGAVEGSAQFFSIRVLFEFPPADGDFSGLDGGGGMPDAVPPFVAELQLWPYAAGQSFITQLDANGGVAEIDEALRTFPLTTEQILHPERYPSDRPSPVDVPDLSSELGDGWGDLDVMQVGEAWLAAMLGLRLESATADAAAAGWDGGLYRAFTDGDDAAVVLATAWDSRADADAFEQAAREWFAADDAPGIVGRPSATRVTMAIATTGDAQVRAALAGAADADV